jgi:hypothetical protein
MAKRTKTTLNDRFVSDNPDELEGALLTAHEIVSERRDLVPSVQRIMDAELDDATRDRAMELFRASLGDLDDPNRNPNVAIENAS